MCGGGGGGDQGLTRLFLETGQQPGSLKAILKRGVKRRDAVLLKLARNLSAHPGKVKQQFPEFIDPLMKLFKKTVCVCVCVCVCLCFVPMVVSVGFVSEAASYLQPCCIVCV